MQLIGCSAVLWFYSFFVSGFSFSFEVSWGNVIELFIGLFITVFCSTVAANTFCCLLYFFMNKPTLVAGKDGIAVRQIRSGVIPWNEVRLASVRRERNLTKSVIISLIDNPLFPLKKKDFFTGESTYVFSSEWFSGDAEEVVKNIMKSHARNYSRLS